MGIGDRIRKLRIQQNLTIKDVAERAGIPVSTYRDWEQGREIKGEPYVKIARALNVSLYELMTGERGNLLKLYAEIEKIELSCQAIRKHAESLS